MQTRGKMKCISEARVNWSQQVRVYKFSAVCNDSTPENERFHRYTPSGSIEITVDNPSVQFELDKNYYVDFSEAQ